MTGHAKLTRYKPSKGALQSDTDVDIFTIQWPKIL
jgi:hypothetical protein